MAAVQSPAISVTGTATKYGDNVVFKPSIAMTPATILATDWKYSVYREATKVYPLDTDWALGAAALEREIPIQLVATGNQIVDKLKITYKGLAFDTLIR